MSPYLLLGTRLALAGVMAVAVAAKVRDAASFRASLEPFGVRRAAARRLAPVVIGLEGAAGVLLLVPATAAVGLALTALLTGAFAAAVARVVRSGGAVRCRCFGGSGGPLGHAHVVRNLTLSAVAAAGAVALALGARGAGDDPAAIALTVAASGTVVTLVVALDDVLALARGTKG